MQTIDGDGVETGNDVLVFLPGQDDIEALSQLLHEHLPNAVSKKSRDAKGVVPNSDGKALFPMGPKGGLAAGTSSMLLSDFDILPLYSTLPPEEQMKVFLPSLKHRRKFILSTNIAETSVTVPGVKYVIDSGFVKTRLMHPVTGYEMLKTIPISKAQANQRAGRAGRICAGTCYRIYMEKVYDGMADTTLPEIQRVNMTQVILQLKQLGVTALKNFPLLSMPSHASVRSAYQTLLMLGALDKVYL